MLQQKQNKDRKTQVSIFYCTRKNRLQTVLEELTKKRKQNLMKKRQLKSISIHYFFFCWQNQHSLFNYIIFLAVLEDILSNANITSICIAKRFSRFKFSVQSWKHPYPYDEESQVICRT